MSQNLRARKLVVSFLAGAVFFNASHFFTQRVFAAPKSKFIRPKHESKLEDSRFSGIAFRSEPTFSKLDDARNLRRNSAKSSTGFVRAWTKFSLSDAQTIAPQIAPNDNETPNRETPKSEMPDGETLERARVLLSIDDARAWPMLRNISRRTLEISQRQPQNTVLKDDAIRALWWLGIAAKKFGARDEATQAWAQAVARTRDFRAQNRIVNAAFSADENASKTALEENVRDDFPLLATDDTLQVLAEIGRWTPRNSTFKPPATLFEYSISRPVISPLVAPVANAQKNETSSQETSPDAREFLVTSGVLPLSGEMARDGNSRLWRTPSLYASFDAANLPPTLRMNRVVYGFARASSTRSSTSRPQTSDAQNWRQIVRVFYAAPETFSVAEHEIESERAGKLCAQFLRVAATFEAVLGQKNRYARNGVTTVWLSREAAEWPQTAPKENWSAGAWIDSAPEQMILFRSGEARSQAEWLRETAHEFSHLALPPFAGFEAPLEPFGNGRAGETLLMLWAAQSPQAFFAPDETDAMRRECEVHVARHAIPALESWRALDPKQPLSTAGDANSLNQLLGLAIEIERVYGAEVLCRALRNTSNNQDETWRRNGIEYSMRRGANRNLTKKPAILGAPNLLRGFETAWRNTQNSPPIWLNGALQHRDEKGKTLALSPRDLTQRAPLLLKPHEIAAGWIYFPAGAKLKISLQNAANSGATNSGATNSGATTLQIDGAWQVTKTRDSLTIFSAEKSGWQKIVLRATRDVVVRYAQFERNTP